MPLHLPVAVVVAVAPLKDTIGVEWNGMDEVRLDKDEDDDEEEEEGEE